jgi:hypothetical protein
MIRPEGIRNRVKELLPGNNSRQATRHLGHADQQKANSTLFQPPERNQGLQFGTGRPQLYGSYEHARMWLFSPRTETVFITDLAARLRAYQDFRSGSATILRESAADPKEFA